MIQNLNEHFGEKWRRVLSPLFPLLEPILAELQTLSKRGKKIFPDSTQTFRAFKECDYDNLKVLVVGLCPFHSITKEKVIIADGIALSCKNTNKEQPSLEKWYDAVSKEFPSEIIERKCDLSYLGHEGILMYNFGLTVEHMKAESHNKLWEPFTEAFIKDVIGVTGVPVILLGKNTHKVEKWLYPFQRCFKLDHPASAAYNQTDWDSEGFFTKVQRIVKDNNSFNLKWWPVQQDSLTLEPEVPADFYF